MNIFQTIQFWKYAMFSQRLDIDMTMRMRAAGVMGRTDLVWDLELVREEDTYQEFLLNNFLSVWPFHAAGVKGTDNELRWRYNIHERIRQWPVTDKVAKGLVQWPSNILDWRLVQRLTSRNPDFKIFDTSHSYGTSTTVRDSNTLHQSRLRDISLCTKLRPLYPWLVIGVFFHMLLQKNLPFRLVASRPPPREPPWCQGTACSRASARSTWTAAPSCWSPPYSPKIGKVKNTLQRK